MGDLRKELSNLNKESEKLISDSFYESLKELKKELTNNGFFTYLETLLKEAAKKGSEKLTLKFIEEGGLIEIKCVSAKNQFNERKVYNIEKYLKYSKSSFWNLKNLFSLNGLYHLSWQEQLQLVTAEFCLNNNLYYYWMNDVTKGYLTPEDFQYEGNKSRKQILKELYAFYSARDNMSLWNRKEVKNLSIRIYW